MHLTTILLMCSIVALNEVIRGVEWEPGHLGFMPSSEMVYDSWRIISAPCTSNWLLKWAYHHLLSRGESYEGSDIYRTLNTLQTNLTYKSDL